MLSLANNKNLYLHEEWVLLEQEAQTQNVGLLRVSLFYSDVTAHIRKMLEEHKD